MKELVKNDNQSGRIVNVYDAPHCEIIAVGHQCVICGSETEKVTETNGEW